MRPLQRLRRLQPSEMTDDELASWIAMCHSVLASQGVPKKGRWAWAASLAVAEEEVARRPGGPGLTAWRPGFRRRLNNARIGHCSIASNASIARACVLGGLKSCWTKVRHPQARAGGPARMAISRCGHFV
jgi:hypothetical protein